jgi:dUTP pyrophosphatase
MKVKLLHPDAKVPTRRIGDAGWDLYARHDYLIRPSQGQLISLGIALEIPLHSVGIIKDRSSLAMRGLHISAGVIDSSYRGDIALVVSNLAQDRSISLFAGDKIAQIILFAIDDWTVPNVEVVEELSETIRGEGGFGSTDKDNLVNLQIIVERILTN